MRMRPAGWVRGLLVPVVWAVAIALWGLAGVFAAIVSASPGTVPARAVAGVAGLVVAGVGCAWGARRLSARTRAATPLTLPEYPLPSRWRLPVPSGAPGGGPERELYLIRYELAWVVDRVMPRRWGPVAVTRPRLLPLLSGGPLLAAGLGIGAGGAAVYGLLGPARPAHAFESVLTWPAALAVLAAGVIGAYRTVRDAVRGVRRLTALSRRERELIGGPRR